MKTLFKIIGAIFVLLIILAVALPFLFQGKITDLAKTEINKSVNANVEFDAIKLSLIKNFPNFTLGIDGLTIEGVGEFQGDTLTYIPSIDITIDLFSVISGSSYEIKKIKINSPSILLKVNKEGMANYDIIPASDDFGEDDSSGDESGEDFTLTLKKVQITNAIIVFKDNESNMDLSAKGMDFSLSGDLSADQTGLLTNTTINDLTLIYDGIPYFSHTQLTYKAEINADLKNEIYTLKENTLNLNQLMLTFDGSVSYINDDLNIVLAFNAPKSDFKNFLSLIPAIYTTDFNTIESSGKLGVDGHIKGLYTETALPAFNINLEVENGNFKYPELPQSVSGVNIQTTISNTGGDADNTVISLNKLNANLGQNALRASLAIKHPISDPDINGKLKGKLDLSTIKDFYPLEAGEELTGSITSDITLKGKLSDVENEAYESFIAIGSILMQNIEFQNTYTGEPVVVSNAQLNFSPQYLDLVSFVCTIGKNDLRANGKINNYLAYTFSDGELEGQLSTQSNYMNINELLIEEESGETAEEEADSTTLSVIEVPGNIDFKMTSTFNKLIYDNFEMEHVNGHISIKDHRLMLKNLSMNMLDGELVVNGEYTTANPDKPEFDFKLDIRDLDIQSAYSTFGILSEFAPIAKKTQGKFSSNLSMRSLLDSQMNPIYETMTGGGKLNTSSLKITDVNSLDKIAEALKYDALKDLSIDPILLLFDFADGKILVEPFELNHKEFKGEMAGWTGFDQAIDYTMNLNIPRSSFGQSANNVLNNLVSQANSKGANFSLGETVSLDVLIGGTLTNPEIKTSLKESGKNLVKDVKKQVEEEIQKQKEELTQQASEKAQKIIEEGDNQAKKIIDEAKNQAEVLKKNAVEAANQVRSEADKQAKKVEAEGKKNGFLAEAAAKETAKQMRKEADKQAGKLEAEADEQAKKIIRVANEQAASIKQSARDEADRILEGN